MVASWPSSGSKLAAASPAAAAAAGGAGGQQPSGSPDTPLVAARLLILGARRVGKSASIVRFTTGRFIQDYCSSTNDWLYRHPLDAGPAARGAGNKSPSGAARQANLVELLEHKDVQFSNSQLSASLDESQPPANRLDTFSVSLGPAGAQHPPQRACSLATRVALDQLNDKEQHEKQQLLAKLSWANAYVVMYAVDDAASFNKAIKYLNLIANNVNQAPGCAPKASAGFLRHRRLSPNHWAGGHANSFGAGSGGLGCAGSQTICAGSAASGSLAGLQHERRPILLLANKLDLAPAGRQVSYNDARLLAIRHQATFAEVSIAESRRHIQLALLSLVEQINPSELHQLGRSSGATRSAAAAAAAADPSAPLSHWRPEPEASAVWASLVSSKPTIQQGRLVVLAAPREVRALAASAALPLKRHSDAAAATPAPLSKIAPLVELQLASSQPLVSRPLVANAIGLLKASARPAAAGAGAAAKPPAAPPPAAPVGRYESFKTSFRKASLAIVGGRSFAKPSALSGPDKRHSNMAPTAALAQEQRRQVARA